MENLIGLIGALLGVLVGGYINYIIVIKQFNKQKEWERKCFLSDKLEEIYKLADEISRKFYLSSFEITKHIHFNKNIQSKSGKIPNEKFNMLINLYFPELKTELENFNIARSVFGKLLTESLKIESESQNVKAEKAGEIFYASNKISESCTVLKERILSISKNLYL